MRAYAIIAGVLLFAPVALQAQEQTEERPQGPFESTTILEAGFGWKASELGVVWDKGTSFTFLLPNHGPSFYATWYAGGKLLIEPQIEFSASTETKTFTLNFSGQLGLLINVRGRYPMYTTFIVKEFKTWKQTSAEKVQVDIGRYGLGLGYRMDVGDIWSVRPELRFETTNITKDLYIQIRLAVGGVLIRK